MFVSSISQYVLPKTKKKKSNLYFIGIFPSKPHQRNAPTSTDVASKLPLYQSKAKQKDTHLNQQYQRRRAATQTPFASAIFQIHCRRRRRRPCHVTTSKWKP